MPHCGDIPGTDGNVTQMQCSRLKFHRQFNTILHAVCNIGQCFVPHAQGVEIQMPRKTLGTSCWTRDVSTQKDAPLTCAGMCQTESLTGWLRDNSTQWERPYEHVHVEHSYADMKWLQEYTSLKGPSACRTKGKV